MSDERDSPIIEFLDKDDSQILDFPKISYNKWLWLAQKTWKQSDSAISIAKAAIMHGIKKSTLWDCIKSATSKAEASQKMQRLSPEEEEALISWILLLASWGWPVKIEQLCDMASELLQARDDTKELGTH